MNELFPIGLWLMAQHDEHVKCWHKKNIAELKHKAQKQADAKWADWFRSLNPEWKPLPTP